MKLSTADLQDLHVTLLDMANYHDEALCAPEGCMALAALEWLHERGVLDQREVMG